MCNIYVLNFNETLTNEVVYFEQPAPGRPHLLFICQVFNLDLVKSVPHVPCLSLIILLDNAIESLG